MPTVATARLACIVVVAALASEAAATVPEVPGDDIFGFTTPTDVGNPGDTGFANENDGRAGKRGGAYRALNAKYELGHTPAPDWWVGVSLFASHHRVRDVPGFADVNRTAFDGLSFEIEHRIVKRTVGNPFAVAVSLEPRWGRVDSVRGLPAHFVNAAFKLFVDAVVVPDKLFWGFNAIWAPQRAEDPADRSRWLSSSGILRFDGDRLSVVAEVLSGRGSPLSRQLQHGPPNAGGWTRGVRRPDAVVESHRHRRVQHDVSASDRRSLDRQSAAPARSRQFRKSTIQGEAHRRIPMKCRTWCVVACSERDIGRLR